MCASMCVCVLEHLLLVGFVFPPLYGPPLLWVLDLAKKVGKAGVSTEVKFLQPFISADMILLIGISSFLQAPGVCLHFSNPLPTLLLFFCHQCFSRGPAGSVHLPQGSRCWVHVQMFCVYLSAISSLPNSRTVNIYRGARSLLQWTRTGEAEEAIRQREQKR